MFQWAAKVWRSSGQDNTILRHLLRKVVVCLDYHLHPGLRDFLSLFFSFTRSSSSSSSAMNRLLLASPYPLWYKNLPKKPASPSKRGVHDSVSHVGDHDDGRQQLHERQLQSNRLRHSSERHVLVRQRRPPMPRVSPAPGGNRLSNRSGEHAKEPPRMPEQA